MATPLDLQEQEQVDNLKAFWSRYGSVLTWALVVVLAGFAAWNGWNTYQRSQALKAGVLFEELDKTVKAGDAQRAARVFEDLRSRYPSTAWAAQAGLLLARLQFDKAQPQEALASLRWVADHAKDEEWSAVARLRASALEWEAGRPDEALKLLQAVSVKSFEALVADRRGDILMSQGKKAEAVASYEAAWKGMPESVDYRRVVEAKLTALGAAPAPPVTLPGAATK